MAAPGTLASAFLDTCDWELSGRLRCPLKSFIICSPEPQKWEMGLLVPKQALEATEESGDADQASIHFLRGPGS